MARSTTTSDAKKTRPARSKTRFFTVNKVQSVRTSLTGAWDRYNRRYLTEPLENGKTLVADLKSDPRKTFAKLMEDGKARFSDLNKEVRTKVDGVASEGQALLTKASKNPRETFSDLMDEGKTLVADLSSGTRDRYEDLLVDVKVIKAGIEKDTRMIMADVVDGGKKALDRLPGKRRFEKELSRRFEAMPAKFNLPSKKDIDGLALQVRKLNTKVNQLSKARSV